MDVEDAQERYDAALQAFAFAKAEVIAADEQKQELDRDLRCGVIGSDDASIGAIDKVFCAARLAMAQARDALEHAQQALDQAERQAQAGPSPRELALAWGRETQAPAYLRYEQYSAIFQTLQENVDPQWHRYRAAVAQELRTLLGNHRQAQEVPA